MHLRQSCPARGWQGRKERDGFGGPPLQPYEAGAAKPQLRRRAREATGDVGDWMGRCGERERSRLVSPGERRILSTTPLQWGAVEEHGLTTLDALEKRMGHTSQGLSDMHQLLEYLLAKMSDGAEAAQGHARTLCRNLIKNHMDTYTALASLRAALTDLSRDPDNCLHSSLERIVGKVDPVALGARPDQVSECRTADDVSTVMGDRAGAAADWLCMSDAETVVHRSEIAERGGLSGCTTPDQHPCSPLGHKQAVSPLGAFEGASSGDPALSLLPIRKAVSELVAAGGPPHVLEQARVLLRSLDSTGIRDVVSPPATAAPESSSAPTQSPAARSSAAEPSLAAAELATIFNETSSSIHTMIQAHSELSSAASSPSAARQDLPAVEEAPLRRETAAGKAVAALRQDAVMVSPLLPSTAHDVMSLGQLAEGEALRITTPRTTMRNKRQSTRGSPGESPSGSPRARQQAHSSASRYCPHPPHTTADEKGVDAVSTAAALLCVCAAAAARASALACEADLREGEGVAEESSASSSSDMREHPRRLRQRKRQRHLHSSLVGSHFLEHLGSVQVDASGEFPAFGRRVAGGGGGGGAGGSPHVLSFAHSSAMAARRAPSSGPTQALA